VHHVQIDVHLPTIIADPPPDNTVNNDKPFAVPIGSYDPNRPDPAPNFLLPRDDGVPSAPSPLHDNYDLPSSMMGSNEVPSASSDPDYYTNCLELWCHRTLHPHGDVSSNAPPLYPAPPGSLLDSRTSIGPEDLNNFPYLQLGLISTPDPSRTFGDALSSLRHDCLLPHLTCMQVSVVDTILLGSVSSLADSGANVCITNDPSLLIDVVEIDPIPLGMATSLPNAPTNPTSLCTHKGFLPMALLDGSIHYQPFLVNRNATDTIISPENVLNNNHRFHWWTQARRKLPVG
jgi:hypothetical protein